jgi:DeoR family fructose operon transcriptional repressor
MRTSARQRRETILAELYKNKEVTASTLADQLSVSEATIRRDLHALHEDGQLELNYGGATLPIKGDYSFRAKALRNVEAKRLIGQLAADLIDNGDQLFVDSGTTCFEMTPSLKTKRGLSVIVNSARLALELDTPTLDVILLGGHYRPDRMDTVGPLAMAALDQLRGYVAFIGADGLSMDFGLTAGDVESAYIFRQAITNARETILLADHSKFRAPSLCKIVDWSPISRVVTDRPVDESWKMFFDEHDIDIVTPTAEQAVAEAS